MTRWEYRAESLKAATGEHMDSLIVRLNELGVDGWEVIDLRMIAVSQFIYVTFKREVPAVCGPQGQRDLPPSTMTFQEH